MFMNFNLPRIAAMAAIFGLGLPLTTATALYSPPAAAVTPADFPVIVQAIDHLLATGPSAKIVSQLWDARAFYSGAVGATTELEITLTTAEAAELGIVGESGAATVVRFGLYGVIAYEVYYTGSLLWDIWDYNTDIEDLEEEYIEASVELGMTEADAVEEYYEDLYENNTYYDNFVDIYCMWCD